MSNMHSQPTSINDLIFPDSATEKRVRQYANNHRHGNIILHGPPGTGKSATARVVASTRNIAAGASYPVPVYNGADFNDAALERMSREWHLQRTTGVDEPYIVIDEVDKLSTAMQHKLRAKLDSTTVGQVVLTTNHLNRVDGALTNRCDAIEMPPINPSQWMEKVRSWLGEEGVSVSDQALEQILGTCDGSIRDLKRAAEDIICEKR